METLYFFILVLTVLMLAYKRVPLVWAMAIMVTATVAWTELRFLFYVPSWFRWSNGIVAVILIGFTIAPLRRLLISDRLWGVFRKALPRVSETEQEALDAKRRQEEQRIAAEEAAIERAKAEQEAAGERGDIPAAVQALRDRKAGNGERHDGDLFPYLCYPTPIMAPSQYPNADGGEAKADKETDPEFL